MAEISYRMGAASALWKPALLPVYLLFGEEDRMKEEAVTALVRHVVDTDFTDFDLERLNASDSTADTILAAAGQAPFGSERRLIVVQGMEQWRDRGKQSEAERLSEGIACLASSACLVLVAAAQEDEDKRKTAVTVKLDNAVKKTGAIIVCRAIKGESLLAWVTDRVQAEGKRIAPDAAELLVGAVGTEMRPLEQEILKLVCYVGERKTVVAQDVALVVASSPEDVMFTTIDAITRRQTDRALVLLGELHHYDPKPQAVAPKLLALLSRQYRMLWQAKFLADKRVNPREVRALPPDLAAELPSEGNIASIAFKAGDLFTLSRNYTWEELTHALDQLLICDLANKGGVTEESGPYGGDLTANLQMLVLELTGTFRDRSGRKAERE
jgi:DNA polymerase-3 subunit delta